MDHQLSTTKTLVQKIVSGGQTGVDRAALDAAMALNIPCGGWCPKGRGAEDGPIDGKYPLEETSTEQVAVRTEWNVRDTDGTLIFNRGELSGGTAYTLVCTIKHQKPNLVIQLEEPVSIERIQQWINEHNIQILNIAGPRASKCPSIYEDVYQLITTSHGFTQE